MPRVSTYLNFRRETEAAFGFYREVFGGEILGPVMRYADMPPSDAQPLPEADRGLVMHMEVAILGGHVLMGTDVPESLGMPFVPGNTAHVMLEPDTRAEAERLYAALSEGGQIEMPLQDMFWGDCFASFRDRYGTRWMINCSEPRAT
ncbi:MAG: VOC family protein [Rubrivivax sp.]